MSMIIEEDKETPIQDAACKVQSVLRVSVGMSGNLVFMVTFTRVHMWNPVYIVDVLVI